MSGISNVMSIKQVVAIDDDHSTLFMCKVIVQKTFKDMMVVTYNNPQEAVDYFQSEFAKNPVETLILLDINMPELSGWEVLDIFLTLDEKIRKYIKVIMLSSSIDPNDKQRATEHPCVRAYLEKPLTLTTLLAMINMIQTEKVCN